MSVLTRLAAIVRPLVSDRTAARAVREVFNQKFKSIGAMTTLQIDPAKQSGSLELALKGEREPIQITVGHYELTTTDGKTFMEIKDLQTSREWITAIAAQLAKSGKLKFEVPEIAKILFQANG